MIKNNQASEKMALTVLDYRRAMDAEGISDRKVRDFRESLGNGPLATRVWAAYFDGEIKPGGVELDFERNGPTLGLPLLSQILGVRRPVPMDDELVGRFFTKPLNGV
jgi:hypothetical protein